MQMQAIDGVDIDFLLDSKHIEIARSRSTDKEWQRFTSVLFSLDNDTVSFQPGFVIYLLRNILRALSALHDKVHGDIGPTNVMINIQGTVIIGLRQVQSEHVKHTRQSVIHGSEICRR